MQISRVNRSKNVARRAYDRLSQVYDLVTGSETPLMQQGLELLAVGAGESVLEIGSGTGKALVELATFVGMTGRVHGIDLSPGMLHRALGRLVRTAAAGRVSLIEGDGTRLPYQSESFTCVFMSFTLDLFDTPEIPVVLGECRRVLKPGGHLGVVAMLKTRQASPAVRLYEWFHDHFPAYIDCRPIDGKAMIQAAGFNIEISLVRQLWGLPVELVIGKKT